MPTSVTHTAADPVSAAAPDTFRPKVAVVPVAGHGTRLRPLSHFIPKELLPVGDKLALWHIVDELSVAGVESVIFVVSPEKRAFVEKCFSAPFPEGDTLMASGSRSFTCLPDFRFVVQPTMRGLGDAVLCAREAVGNFPFVVALGDAVYEETEPGGLTHRLIEAFVQNSASLALAVQRVPEEQVRRYGVVRPVTGQASDAAVIAIDGIVEKPEPLEAPSLLAAAARYVLAPGIFESLAATLPDKKGEVQLTSALQSLLDSGTAGYAVPLLSTEVRHDIGSLELYYRAFAIFAMNDPERGEGFRRFLRERL